MNVYSNLANYDFNRYHEQFWWKIFFFKTQCDFIPMQTFNDNNDVEDDDGTDDVKIL